MRLNKLVDVTGGVLLITTTSVVVNAPSAQADEVGTLGFSTWKLWDQQDDGKDVEIDIWNATRDPNTFEYGFYNRLGNDSVIEVSDDGTSPRK